AFAGGATAALMLPPGFARSLIFDLRGPVQHYRDLSARIVCEKVAHKELAGIPVGGVLIHVGCHIEPEQGFWEADFEVAIGTNIRCHQGGVVRYENQFPSIPPPDWIPAAGSGDLTFPIHRRKGADVDLVLSRVIHE